VQEATAEVIQEPSLNRFTDRQLRRCEGRLSGRDFPSDFVWGAATSAYQIEGAVDVDGRGESIWDTFCKRPGAVLNGDSGAVACDFYHRYPQDIELMRTLGIDAFRFSIAWPRVLPEGRGRVNQVGLDFYDRFVDELLAAGIRPFATLYHWDLPQALEDAGGWPMRATAEAFVEYVELVAARLGDRIDNWTTHNEPFCTSWLGYGVGIHAPGRTDLADSAAAAHHVLLSHGLAVQALRRDCPDAELGIVLDSWPIHPASDDPRDIAAASVADGFRNRIFFDPVLRGSYPEDVLERLGPAAPLVLDGDLAIISAPLDFLGVNNYSRSIVRAGEDGEPIELPAPAGPTTSMGWEVYPDAIYEVLTRLHSEYDTPPIYVTENGAAFADVRAADGSVDDPDRIVYLTGYVDAVARAMAEGVPVLGYFVWSLLDNFEWSYGYSQRFGLIYVDFETLERVPKSSFEWYRGLAASGRAPELTPV
jgi:beta-glucosidase